MPVFESTPPKDERGVALSLFRTPSFKPITGIITSHDLVGCYTHFYHGRTTPHEPENCQPCQDGLPYRWHAWVAAISKKPRTHFLFECTAQAAEAFVHYRKAHGTLRGCFFRSQRLTKQPNGRVRIETQQADLSDIVLPQEPDLTVALSIIWNIAAPAIEPKGIRKNMPALRISPEPPDALPIGKSNGSVLSRPSGKRPG